MSAITIPARQCGKSFTDLQARLLNALFDAGGTMTCHELETRLRVTRRDLWHAIRAQAVLGNVENAGDIALTSAARAAIAAGRSMARRTFVVTEEYRATRRAKDTTAPSLPSWPVILPCLIVAFATLFSLCLLGWPGA